MSMTITNASREVRVKDDSESVSAVASCVASGLLRGARGNSEARGGGIADEGREIGLGYLDNAEMIFKSYQGKSSLQK